MKNTIRYFLLLTIITGTFFTACGPDVIPPAAEPAVEDGAILDADVVNDGEELGGADAVVEDDATVAPVPAAEDDSVYEDGQYSETGSYESPAGAESIDVTLELKDDMVTSLTVTSNATVEKSKAMQQLFIDGIGAVVIGKNIDELGELAQVNGSSLTPQGFKKAVEAIKAEAQNG